MKKTTNMRAGFTMVELIFVIVIIGILAAVAMNKMSATRDDAKVAKAVSNLKGCITDIQNSYTATQKESSGTASDGSDGFDTCKAVKDDACFAIAGVQGTTASDGNITTDTNGTNYTTTQWCPLAYQSAKKKNLVGNAGTAKTLSFGGAHIVE